MAGMSSTASTGRADGVSDSGNGRSGAGCDAIRSGAGCTRSTSAYAAARDGAGGSASGDGAGTGSSAATCVAAASTGTKIGSGSEISGTGTEATAAGCSTIASTRAGGGTGAGSTGGGTIAGAARSAGGAAAMVVPHLPQNRAPGLSGAAQPGQDATEGAALTAGGATGVCSEVPHFEHARASALQLLPQAGQGRVSAVRTAAVACILLPHLAQNRAPSLFSAWHWEQFTNLHFQSSLPCPESVRVTLQVC